MSRAFKPRRKPFSMSFRWCFLPFNTQKKALNGKDDGNDDSSENSICYSYERSVAFAYISAFWLDHCESLLDSVCVFFHSFTLLRSALFSCDIRTMWPFSSHNNHTMLHCFLFEFIKSIKKKRHNIVYLRFIFISNCEENVRQVLCVYRFHFVRAHALAELLIVCFVLVLLSPLCV